MTSDTENPDFQAHDALFHAYQAKGGMLSYSEWMHAKAAKAVANGRVHATLGLNLKRDPDWFAAGRANFEQLLEHHPFPRTARLCDYGCGSLRVAKHFIERQDAGTFIGMDPTSEFIDLARPHLTELIALKAPLLGSVAELTNPAIKANIDVLYTVSVLRHVPPAERPTFFNTIARIAHAKGAVIILDAHLTKAATRFAKSGWSSTIDDLQQALPAFDLIRDCPKASRGDTRDYGTKRHDLVFRRTG